VRFWNPGQLRFFADCSSVPSAAYGCVFICVCVHWQSQRITCYDWKCKFIAFRISVRLNSWESLFSGAVLSRFRERQVSLPPRLRETVTVHLQFDCGYSSRNSDSGARRLVAQPHNVPSDTPFLYLGDFMVSDEWISFLWHGISRGDLVILFYDASHQVCGDFTLPTACEGTLSECTDVFRIFNTSRSSWWWDVFEQFRILFSVACVGGAQQQRWDSQRCIYPLATWAVRSSWAAGIWPPMTSSGFF